MHQDRPLLPHVSQSCVFSQHLRGDVCASCRCEEPVQVLCEVVLCHWLEAIRIKTLVLFIELDEQVTCRIMAKPLNQDGVQLLRNGDDLRSWHGFALLVVDVEDLCA